MAYKSRQAKMTQKYIIKTWVAMAAFFQFIRTFKVRPCRNIEVNVMTRRYSASFVIFYSIVSWDARLVA